MAAAEKAGSPRRAPRRVLIVDDEPRLCTAVAELLELAAFEVVGVADSHDAAIASAAQSKPDVAVVDLYLAGKSGIGLTRALTDQGILVLVYTGREDRESLVAAMQAGAAGLASKVDPMAQLATAISAIGSGETFVAPRLRRLFHRREEGILSPREREVLFLLATGLTNEQLAQELGLSSETTRTQIRNAMRKLGAHTRVEAVTLAAARGEITLP